MILGIIIFALKEPVSVGPISEPQIASSLFEALLRFYKTFILASSVFFNTP